MQPEEIRMRCLELTIDLALASVIKAESQSEVLKFAHNLARFVVHNTTQPPNWKD